MQDIHAPMAGSTLMDYAVSKDKAESKQVYTTSKLYEDCGRRGSPLEFDVWRYLHHLEAGGPHHVQHSLIAEEMT